MSVVSVFISACGGSYCTWIMRKLSRPTCNISSFATCSVMSLVFFNLRSVSSTHMLCKVQFLL